MDPQPPPTPANTAGSPNESHPAGVRKDVKALIIGSAVLFLLILVACVMAWKALPTLGKAHVAEERVFAQRVEAAKPKEALTEEQKASAMSFGEALEGQLVAGKAAPDLVDSQLFADRVCLHLGPAADLNETKHEILRGSAKTATAMLAPLIGCQLKCLRVTSREGFPAVLLRALDEKNGLRYFDVLLRIANGQMKAVDVFSYGYAAYVSGDRADALRFTKDSEEVPAVNTPLDRVGQEAYKNMAASLRLGNPEVVLAHYQELPESLREERALFQMYVQALVLAAEPSPELVELQREAFKKAERVFGKDSTSALLALDSQIQTGDFAGAEESLKATEAVVGPDAYLTTLQALLKLKQNQLAEAEHLRDEASAREPELDVLADLKRLIFAAKKNYQALVDDLRAFKAKHGHSLSRGALDQQPELADFLKSPEYAKWLLEDQ